MNQVFSRQAGGGQGTPSLEVESNIHGGKSTYGLTNSVINIGRDPSNDIVIDAPVVSAFHAQIQRQGNQLILIHPYPSQPHTTNGLLYQNRHIGGNESFRKSLVCGDIFCIGKEPGPLVTLTYNDGSGVVRRIAPAVQGSAPQFSSVSQNPPVTSTQVKGMSAQVKVALIGALATIIAALISAPFIVPKPPPGHDSSTTPTTTSIPQLHSSYQGTESNLTRNQTFSVSMFDVTENTSTGTFTASMTVGSCTGQVNNGTVTASSDVNFTFTATSSAACGAETAEFKGYINSAGGVSGNWDAPNGGGKGSFNLS